VETSGVFSVSVSISGRSQGSQGHWNTFSNESQLLCSREMQLLFLGQWEGQLDWKHLVAECTLHYLFVCMFCFCFLLFIVFYIARSIVLSVLFSFLFSSCYTAIIIIN